jgi:MFS family permease
MIVGPLATFVLSKTSTQTAMAFGVATATGSLIAASFASKIWHLFLTQGVGFGIGMGFLYTISTGTISQWFDKKRSVANGLTAAGSGTGGLIFSLAIRGMLSQITIAWTFRIVAACVFVVNTGCTVLIRDRNKQINPNQRWFDPGLLRRYQFQLLLSWCFFSILGYTIILFSLPDFATFRGMSKNQGSILNALLNMSMAFGRPLVGLTSDYAGRINVSGLTTVATAISCFAIWVPATSFAVSLTFAVVGGAVCGTFWTTIAPLWYDSLISSVSICH